MLRVDLIKADIQANLEYLPERFVDGQFYDPASRCMCFWGWLAHRVSGLAPEALVVGPYSKAWDILNKRYREMDDDTLLDLYVVRADNIIRAATGHPQVVVNQVLASLPNYPE